MILAINNIAPLVPYLVGMFFITIMLVIITILASWGSYMEGSPNYEFKDGRYVKRQKIDKIEIIIEYVDKTKSEQSDDTDNKVTSF